MLELALKADTAVKLIKLKKQAQLELGGTFSIAGEEDVRELLLTTATFNHAHSSVKDMALELVDVVESLDVKSRHRDFINQCRGIVDDTPKRKQKMMYRGQAVMDSLEVDDYAATSVESPVYRGQSVAGSEEAEAKNHKEKVIYYRGQKIIKS